MIKCPNCGFENDDSCTFCAICGSPVIDSSFYVHNTAKHTDISVDDLNKMLITQGARTKSFTKLDKAALNKAKAALANKENYVKNYSKASDDSDNTKVAEASSSNRVKQANQISGTDNSAGNAESQSDKESEKNEAEYDNAKSTPAAHIADGTTVSEGSSDAYSPCRTASPVQENPLSADNDSKLFRLMSKFFFGTKDETSCFKQSDIESNSTLAVLSYIPFMFFIPMIIKPASGYLRYHGIQGLTMFLTFAGLEFVDVLLCAIANAAVPGAVGSYISIAVTLIANLCVLLLIAIGIANAVKGYARELPIIGRIRLLKQ